MTAQRRPRAFMRRRHPGKSRVAALLIEHRRLSAVLTLAARETPAIRWAVYDLADIETELRALGHECPGAWFPH